MDRARPRPVDDAGRAIVGKNTERHKEIYRRSEATMFLTGTMFALTTRTKNLLRTLKTHASHPETTHCTPKIAPHYNKGFPNERAPFQKSRYK